MNKVRTVVTLIGVAVSGLLLAVGSASAQDISLMFRAGRVTLVARDMTVPAILDRWARVGGTAIVNGDGVTSGPVTLQLIDMPECEVLDILLRGTGGYIASARGDVAANASAIDRILILPKSAAPVRAAFGGSSVPAPAPVVRSEFADEQAANAAPAADGPFIGVVGESVQPNAASMTGPVNAGQGAVPMRPAGAFGSARPGEATPAPQPLFQPTPTATSRPGETPPPPPAVRQSPGPQIRPQQQ